MEGRTLISEALLTSAESTEVLGGLWDYIIVEVELDSTSLLCNGIDMSALETKGGVGRWG